MHDFSRIKSFFLFLKYDFIFSIKIISQTVENYQPPESISVLVRRSSRSPPHAHCAAGPSSRSPLTRRPPGALVALATTPPRELAAADRLVLTSNEGDGDFDVYTLCCMYMLL